MTGSSPSFQEERGVDWYPKCLLENHGNHLTEAKGTGKGASRIGLASEPKDSNDVPSSAQEVSSLHQGLPV